MQYKQKLQFRKSTNVWIFHNGENKYTPDEGDSESPALDPYTSSDLSWTFPKKSKKKENQ